MTLWQSTAKRSASAPAVWMGSWNPCGASLCNCEEQDEQRGGDVPWLGQLCADTGLNSDRIKVRVMAMAVVMNL